MTADASANAPLTSLPGLTVSASETDSAASPAVLTTVAAPAASYVRATAGTNAPKLGVLPRVSDSIEATLPPTLPSELLVLRPVSGIDSVAVSEPDVT